MLLRYIKKITLPAEVLSRFDVGCETKRGQEPNKPNTLGYKQIQFKHFDTVAGLEIDLLLKLSTCTF